MTSGNGQSACLNILLNVVVLIDIPPMENISL